MKDPQLGRPRVRSLVGIGPHVAKYTIHSRPKSGNQYIFIFYDSFVKKLHSLHKVSEK